MPPNSTVSTLSPTTFLQRVLPWFKKGTWSVLEQGLFAGSNFLLNILLVRWLTPDAYGAFTVAFTVFLLLGTVHTGLLTEPMLVFGAGKFTQRFPAYLRTLLRDHLYLTLLFAAGLAVTSALLWGIGNTLLGLTFGMLALAQGFMLFIWLIRRACYAKLQPALAAAGGACYFVLLVGGLFVLQQFKALSLASGLLLLAVAGAGAGILIWQGLRKPQGIPADASFVKVVRQTHWNYGKWAATTGALQWVPGHLAFLVLPIWAGLEAGGALKALLVMVMPVAHIYGALSVLMVPMLVKARERAGFGRLVLGLIALITLGTCVYWALLSWWGPDLMRWLYAGQFGEYTGFLWLVGALPVLSGVEALLGAALRALERPNEIFWAHVVATGAALTVGLWLIAVYGIWGALIGFLLQMALELVVMTYFLVRSA